MKRVAVLLTVFNRKDVTLACLGCLYAQEPVEGVELDVYLVNDGCTDGTPEAVRAQYPEVNVIDADGSLYWNRGMYTAWKTAVEAKDYDYYLWLNDDTFVRPSMMRLLIDGARLTADRAIIVGATCSKDKKAITYGGRAKNNRIPLPNGKLISVEYFNGNIVLVPRYVYNKVGNFDYYFTHSKGDFDYGLRAAKQGIGIFQAGEILGECDEHPTLDTWCNPSVPFRQRWEMLHRPNGMPPKEIFHLERRHNGLAKATFHYITVYIRCLLPWVWQAKEKVGQKGNESRITPVG